MSSLQQVPATGDNQDRRRITVISANLGGGSALACLSLARALDLRYDVQLIGTLYGTEKGPGLRDTNYPVEIYPGQPLPGYLKTMRKMQKAIRGDVVLAHQFRLPSYGLALMKRYSNGTPCALYIDDDDLALTMPGRKNRLHDRLRAANGDIPTRLMHRLRGRADAIFCGSGYFASRFGGVTVPLGRDASLYEPESSERAGIRAQFGFDDDSVVIGFMGNPRAHVGIDDLVAAMELCDGGNYALFVVPPGKLSDYGTALFRHSPVRVVVAEDQPSDAVPTLLAASDIVVVPQRQEAITQGQLPARLVEAMAMAKPIITTRLSDVPTMLGDAARYVDDRAPHDIAAELTWIRDNPNEAAAMGRRARGIFLEQLSLQAMCDRMAPELDRLLASRKRHPQ